MKLMFKRPGEGNGVMGETTTVKTSRKRHNKFLLIGVLSALFIAVASYMLVELQARPSIKIGTGKDVTATVQVLSRDEQEQIADVWVPLPSFDMDWAYAKAVALSALDRHDQALKVFDALDGTGKASYYVYAEYALTASRAQNNQLAVAMMKKALEKLESDSTVAATEKTVLKRRLPSKLEAFSGGAKE